MEKIKQFLESKLNSQKGKDIMIVFIVVLVGLSSFGLGRLSKNEVNTGLKIEYTDQQANIINTIYSKVPIVSNSIGKSFFASSRGVKYYSIGCSAGKTIKQENRIYFFTNEEAEKAGYELSSSCK